MNTVKIDLDVLNGRIDQFESPVSGPREDVGERLDESDCSA